jgi:hypothetical protein
MVAPKKGLAGSALEARQLLVAPDKDQGGDCDSPTFIAVSSAVCSSR